MAKQKEEPDTPVALELRIPDAAVNPSFANFVQSNVSTLQDGPTLTTLTFIHIFSVPTSPTESTPQGEVVTRVVMSAETVASLRKLLNDQQRRLLKTGKPKQRQKRT